MKNNIIYLSKSEQEKLNEYEKEHKKISFRTLLNKLNINVILCNNIPNIDDTIFYNIETGQDVEELDEIYQYFIIDANEWDIDYIKKHYKNEFIIAYSETLENYVLMVDFWGTSWDYVLTNTTYTDDLEKVIKIHEEEEKDGE